MGTVAFAQDCLPDFSVSGNLWNVVSFLTRQLFMGFDHSRNLLQEIGDWPAVDRNAWSECSINPSESYDPNSPSSSP